MVKLLKQAFYASPNLNRLNERAGILLNIQNTEYTAFSSPLPHR